MKGGFKLRLSSGTRHQVEEVSNGICQVEEGVKWRRCQMEYVKWKKVSGGRWYYVKG